VSFIFCLTLFNVHILDAQTFLSSQKTIIEKSSINQTNALLEDSISGQSQKPIFNHKEVKRPSLLRSQVRSQALSDKKLSVISPDNKYVIVKEESAVESVPLPLHLSLNRGSMVIILNLINTGEFNLALEIINNLPDEIEETVEKEQEFYLKELRQYYLVLIHFHLVNFQNTVDAAEIYFKDFSNGKMYYEVYYYFAEALSNLGQPIQLTYLVTDDFFTQLPARKSEKLRYLLIQDSINKDQFVTALSLLEDINKQFIPEYEKWSNLIIEKVSKIDDVDAILDQYEDRYINSRAQLRKVQILIRKGQYREAQILLDFLLSNEEIDEGLITELQSLQSFIEIALNTEPDRIGVILPFSHKQFGRLAYEVLDGLELALQKQYSGARSFQLILRDSTPKKTQDKDKRLQPRLRLMNRVNLVKQQLKELVEEERVVAIFGPLAKQTSLAAGEVADLYKVPVICFSKTENIGQNLPFLFRFQKNKMHEAETLAHYALDYLSAKRFVLFYNTDSSGKGFKVMQAFGDVIQKNGGTIVGMSKVKRKQTDFQDSFLSITGGFRKIAEEEQEELKKSRERLQPIVDFDVVFAPVTPDKLKIIIDFCRSFEAQSVWVLSGSDINVNENQLLSNAARLRFVDSFPVSNVKTFLQPFFESHWRAYNHRKGYKLPTDYTIYAFEAMEIVAKLLNNPSINSRESLRDALDNLKAFPVLTGNATTKENGEISKDLKILGIRGKNTISIF